MQEIEYEDGTKTREFHNSLLEALEDTKEKARKKSIKSVKITMIIPSGKRNRGNSNSV